VLRRDERLNHEPIDCLWSGFGEIQASQIDFAIPGLEKAEVGFQT
jgi:hypothetical protein